MLKEESCGEPEERGSEPQIEEMQKSAHRQGTAGPSEFMETTPVSEQAAEQAGVPGRLLEACPVCDALLDVTDQAPLAQVSCPGCGQPLQAHRQFNNYRLVAILGEGGMGSVFKAVDLNLNRSVALKILKKECSANEEERAKLEEEARITASINNPHVVKVFSFGEDHGQFYLAMELAEKGSLDDLMGIQQRLSEIQVLQVGIQIAEGLDAALERNLIHRDIKPGNILFSDPHTAKLVDFGLAVVMDEAAHARGELWGTPYYIAPEKLDNQPEDFRSDIYSLGGTLFHALAGRPPYDAETPSTVALKQLMSKPVSLQAFAPDVSSETAYVINRMLAKDPDQRYASYSELIEHLSYARRKLLERTRQPPKPRERMVVESQASRNLAGLLSLGLLTLLAVSCVIYVFRESIFGPSSHPAAPATQSTAYTAAQWKDMFLRAVRLLGDRQAAPAVAAFDRLVTLTGSAQPMKNWVRMNGALAALVAGDGKEAARRFEEIAQDGTYSTEEPDRLLASFFVEASKQLAKPKKRIPSSITRLYSNTNFEAFGLLCFAVHNWDIGDLENASSIFKSFLAATIPESEAWIEDYKPLAADYHGACVLLAPIEEALPKAIDAASAQSLLGKVRSARESIRIPRATARLEAIEGQLVAKGANANIP
ncbi:MAG: serine/threonine-protein kinase [Terrimicrobiaceae bacterium]